MRALVWIACLVAAPAAADPVHDFAARWPHVAPAITPGLARALWQGRPCAAYDATRTGPAIDDTTPASTSPDGTLLVVVTTLDLDAATSQRFGVPPGELAPYAIVVDGPRGRIWVTDLTVFPLCNPNPFDFTWSHDGARVLVGTDSGHGERLALLDAAAHRVLAAAFANLSEPSPELRHLATTPWSSGWPVDAGSDVVYGTVLRIDGRDIWGSDEPGAASDVWDLAWRSDRELTFCGQRGMHAPARYRAVIGRTIAVSRTGTCPSDP